MKTLDVIFWTTHIYAHMYMHTHKLHTHKHMHRHKHTPIEGSCKISFKIYYKILIMNLGWVSAAESAQHMWGPRLGLISSTVKQQ